MQEYRQERIVMRRRRLPVHDRGRQHKRRDPPTDLGFAHVCRSLYLGPEDL